MNKIIISLFIVLFFSCSSSKHKQTQDSISIEQNGAIFPVIIRGNLDENRIFSVNFPFVFQYNNNSLKERKIKSIDYYYCKDYGKAYMNRRGGWNGVKMYEYVKDSLIRIGTNYRSKAINGLEKQEFIIYTSHDINRVDSIQLELKPYFDQMKARGTTCGKDTISIGSFLEFKQKHPELTKILLEGDSVSFDLFNIDNKLDTVIVLPIKY